MSVKSANTLRFILSTASLVAMMASGNAAWAQSNPPSAAEVQEAAPASAGDIIVTAQRRAEALQDVPITLSAFSEKSLETRRLDGAPELLRAIPNVNFSKGYFAGFNFSIRGVGTQLGTASGDTGVGVHLNNIPLITNRFFEADFYDVERVEVLRGPQGTLYGRNATGGVVNVVTAKPTNEFGGSLTGEIATYGSYKARGWLNVPLIDDAVLFRVAGSALTRQGFGINTYSGKNVDGRKLWSGRATLLVKPVDGVEASVMYQHFQEDDTRTRTGGAICTKDPGPSSVGGVAVNDPIIRGYLSQGCTTGSIYGANSNQAPNSLATIFGYAAQNFGLTSGDYFAGKTISRNLHDTDSLTEPRYLANNDLVEFQLGVRITPSLKFTALTAYYDDQLVGAREAQGAVPTQAFANTVYTPGGLYADPQIGTFDRYSSRDIITHKSDQFFQELRLDSSFDGPFNFSLGANYIKYHGTLVDYVASNLFTAYAQILNTTAFGMPNCPINTPSCIYIQPSADYTLEQGHNFFASKSPYTLTSRAVFGEVYYNLTSNVKATLGGRFTHDHKRQIVLPPELLVRGSGLPTGPIPEVNIDFREPTGRFALDWKPDLGFTDSTLIYGVVSRGYKAGGTNSPNAAGLQPPYKPEFVNAGEVGIKNTLLDGQLTLNLAGFIYKYKDYQVSESRNRTSQIQNINANVKGLEFETVFQPTHRLRFDATIGLLDTKITKGSFVDPSNFINGTAGLTLARGVSGSTCAVNTAALATYLATQPTSAAFVASVCPGRVPGLVPNLIGVETNLVGRELPNAPNWTVSAGAEYTADLGDRWKATLRGDYYRQGSSWARTYNLPGDKIRGWDNANVTLTLNDPTDGWQLQAFIKNAFDKQAITNTFLLDQIFGLTRIGFVTEPRIVGGSVTKNF